MLLSRWMSAVAFVDEELFPCQLPFVQFHQNKQVWETLCTHTLSLLLLCKRLKKKQKQNVPALHSFVLERTKIKHYCALQSGCVVRCGQTTKNLMQSSKQPFFDDGGVRSLSASERASERTFMGVRFWQFPHSSSAHDLFLPSFCLHERVAKRGSKIAQPEMQD